MKSNLFGSFLQENDDDKHYGVHTHSSNTHYKRKQCIRCDTAIGVIKNLNVPFRRKKSDQLTLSGLLSETFVVRQAPDKFRSRKIDLYL